MKRCLCVLMLLVLLPLAAPDRGALCGDHRICRCTGNRGGKHMKRYLCVLVLLLADLVGELLA